MINNIRKIKKAVGRAIVNSIAFAIVLSALVFAYVSLVPVDVLKDWSYTIYKDTYTTGETIVITSHFKKIRNVTGISRRYIYCKTPSGSYSRDPIGEASADRPAQSGSADIYLSIPSALPTLPTTCYIEANIDYTIYTFRKHTEINRTSEFTVIKKETVKKSNPLNSEDTDNAVIENSPKSGNDFSDTFPVPHSENQTPIKEDQPRTPDAPPGFIDRVVDGVQSGASRIVKGITNLF